MFNDIVNLMPYILSIRVIQNKLSLDVIIPVKWFYETQIEGILIELQESDDKNKLISLYTEISEENYKLLINAANSIIKYNIELAQKEHLLSEKMFELQELFKRESLDTLKELNINVSKN